MSYLMGLTSVFKKLFSSGSPGASQSEEPIEHNGLQVLAEPIQEGSQYRTAGYIQKMDGDGVQRTRFIRADNHSSRDAAIAHAVQKGKQIIDEQGEAVLQRDHA